MNSGSSYAGLTRVSMRRHRVMDCRVIGERSDAVLATAMLGNDDDRIVRGATHLRRRELILMAGAAAAWPLSARAQQPAMPVIGLLNSGTLATNAAHLAALRQGLKEAGFVDGQNVTIELRWAENQYDRLPALASDLVHGSATVIVGNTLAALSAKTVTTTIPIVFTTGSDPVRDGLVASLNRPGGNITGVVFITERLGAKRLELLRRLMPKPATIAMLVNPNTGETEAERKEVQAAAVAIGQQLIALDIASVADIDNAFATLVQRGAGALLAGTGTFVFNNLQRIVALAARDRIPTMYTAREAVVAGGLTSYGSSISDAYRQAGIYVGRILRGEKPADLPVMQSTKFEFLINLKAAKALGLEISPTLLALADEVIE
jgi:putative ABC transport system substrate-binding protein